MRCKPWLAVFACLLGCGLPPALRADEKADALLKEMQDTLKAAQTFSAKSSVKVESKEQKVVMQHDMTMQLKRPNLLRLEVKMRNDGDNSRTMVSDGKNLWMLMQPENQYQKMATPPEGRMLDGSLMMPVGFFDPQTLTMFGPEKKTRFVGSQTVDDKEYTVIEITTEQPTPIKANLFVGADKLLHRAEMNIGPDGNMKYVIEYADIKIGEETSDSAFAFKPPAGAKAAKSPEDDLLAVGRKAPSFKLPAPSGKTITLENTLKGKKAVLVNFWFHG
ncbi:MAG: DUF2092 domain-containing protein [Armatimonadetes bacterium]|nr:DUF2092 domain-containing protein [Armatimonadota bacterium]